jgi:hypothetical protein
MYVGAFWILLRIERLCLSTGSSIVRPGKFANKNPYVKRRFMPETYQTMSVGAASRIDPRSHPQTAAHARFYF